MVVRNKKLGSLDILLYNPMARGVTQIEVSIMIAEDGTVTLYNKDLLILVECKLALSTNDCLVSERCNKNVGRK